MCKCELCFLSKQQVHTLRHQYPELDARIRRFQRVGTKMSAKEKEKLNLHMASMVEHVRLFKTVRSGTEGLESMGASPASTKGQSDIQTLSHEERHAREQLLNEQVQERKKLARQASKMTASMDDLDSLEAMVGASSGVMPPRPSPSTEHSDSGAYQRSRQDLVVDKISRDILALQADHRMTNQRLDDLVDVLTEIRTMVRATTSQRGNI